MAAPKNYRSHNQPSPPAGWMDAHCPWWSAPVRGWFGADWYKHRTKDGRPLNYRERRKFRRLRLLSTVGAYTDEYHHEDKAMFDLYHENQFEALEPRIPAFPVVEWLAVQIFYWYGPLCWSVDLTAADWVEQLRAADERNSFSYAECEAQAAKWGYLMPIEEASILKKITREG